MRRRNLYGAWLVMTACSGSPSGDVPTAPARLSPADLSARGSPADDAAAAYVKENDLTVLDVAPRPGSSAPEPALERSAMGVDVAGLEQGESVVSVRQPDGPQQLAFKTPPYGTSCDSPPPQTDYRVAQSGDGSIVILRLVPKIREVREHRAGACGVGCGPQPPPPAPLLFVIPDTPRVRVVTVPWDAEHRVVTCDQYLPRP